MRALIDSFWGQLEATSQKYQVKDSSICFNVETYDEYCKLFKTIYDDIKDRYMKKNVQALDRHKVAAVFIVSTLEANVITYEKELSDNHHFLGKEMFATEVAWAWMLKSFNEKLKDVGLKTVESYHMPVPFACETPYFDIFSRNLYFSKSNTKLIVLDIAEKLFLLEYITLLYNDIDPKLLQD
ncbi:MAG: hypothetical protein J1E00_02605 [Oscillospiraceae bacterium]|nr:hypothetical protein [Oscillospiraceae bacterium]